EHVAEVAVAARAAHLGADHAVGAVLVLGDRVAGDRLRERRPAGAGLVLLAGAEERVAAGGADVGARFLGADEAALPRPLGAVLAEHLVLLGREPPAPLLVAEDEPVHVASTLP